MSKLIELKKVLDQTHRDDNEDPEKNWMQEHAKTKEVAKLIGNSFLFTHSELKILSELSVKGTMLFKDLQDNSELSQGMLSRYIARLSKKNLIEKYHTKENKKSVVLKITDTGKEIGELHQELHKSQNKSYEEMLNKYTVAEVDMVINFLNDVIEVRNEWKRR